MLSLENTYKFSTNDIICCQHCNRDSDYLVLRDKVVYRHDKYSSAVIKQYSCENDPIAAAAFKFNVRDDSSDQVVAILITPELLRLHLSSGQAHSIFLPFSACTIYSSTVGLIIQRNISKSPQSIYDNEHGRAIFFTVTQNATFVRPICYLDKRYSSSMDMDIEGFANKSKNPYTYNHTRLNHLQDDHTFTVYGKYMCSYAKSTGQISVWLLKSMSSSGFPHSSDSMVTSPNSFERSDSMNISGGADNSYTTHRKAAKNRSRASPAVSSKNDTLANILGVSSTQDLEELATGNSVVRPLEPAAHMVWLCTVDDKFEVSSFALVKSIKVIIILP